MASLNYDNNPNKVAGIAGSSPKADGLTSCLHRINSIAGQLYENNLRLTGLATLIGGSEVLKDGPEAVPEPMPENALWLARQIEQGLQQIMETQRHQINRIENAIG